MSKKINQILHFWFETQVSWDSTPSQQLVMKWFKGGPEVDKTIQSLFMQDLKTIANGGHQDWKETKQGCLAYILVADQFARNCCKKQNRFYDSLAMKITQYVVKNKELYQSYYPIERHFVLMPFMHSEKLQDQKQFQSRWNQVILLCKQKNYPYLKMAQNVGFFGKSHLQIVEKFGRFPYYNQSMKRQSTPEQQEWLKNFKGFA